MTETSADKQEINFAYTYNVWYDTANSQTVILS